MTQPNIDFETKLIGEHADNGPVNNGGGDLSGDSTAQESCCKPRLKLLGAARR